jgi:hypothetical protein
VCGELTGSVPCRRRGSRRITYGFNENERMVPKIDGRGISDDMLTVFEPGRGLTIGMLSYPN